MNFHTIAYSESLAQLTNTDVNAASDDVLQLRNSHIILSEPFNLLAAHTHGTTLDRLRFGNVALTYRGSNHIWPINQAAVPPSRPRLYDLRSMPLALPTNEEITLEATTNAAGPANTGAILWLAKPNWTMNIPRGLTWLQSRATATIVAGSATTWGALATLVFERDLYNGVYAVVGAHAVLATGIAFRLFFPSQPLAGGRQLRPGGLVQAAIGNFPWEAQCRGLGEWGRFHTFEVPSVQLFGDAAGGTLDVRLDLVYLGADENLLHQTGQGGLGA